MKEVKVLRDFTERMREIECDLFYDLGIVWKRD